MGVTVLAADGGAYSTGTFDNLKYTTTDGSTFSTTTAPSLVSAEAKAAAYYPWASGTDITAVPVTTAAQTDYMYSGWYTGLKDSNPQAKFNMKHALAAVRIGVQKSAGYTPTATLTAVQATSDAFYASATLDATSSTGTLSGLTGPGAVLEKTSLSQALSTTPYTTDFLVVPGTSAQTITFTVTIGGSEYTAITAAVTLQQGAIHSYTLTLSAEGLTVTGTTVEPWTTLDKGSLTLQKYELSWDNAPDGVYAIATDYSLVKVDVANESCIGVALIESDAPVPQRLWIEKYESYGDTYDGCISGYSGVHYNTLDGVNDIYGVGGSFNYNVNEWTSGALSDFNGKEHSSVVSVNYSGGGIGGALAGFLSDFPQNHFRQDWYIPALGQLALIYINKTDINTALNKIGGTPFANEAYWSSTEDEKNTVNSISQGWFVSFSGTNCIMGSTLSINDYRVRLVRDIVEGEGPIETITFNIGTATYYALRDMTWSEWIASFFNNNIYMESGSTVVSPINMVKVNDVQSTDKIIEGQTYTVSGYGSFPG